MQRAVFDARSLSTFQREARIQWQRCVWGRGGGMFAGGLNHIVVTKGEQQCAQASPSQRFVLARAVLNRTAYLAYTYVM